jgi:hypothetical protein
MNKAECKSPTFTLSATQTFTYRDNNANTAFNLKEIVTTPTDCRTLMSYALSGFSSISANFDKTALSTSMAAPVLTVNKFTNNAVNRISHTGQIYLETLGGPVFSSTGQKWDFTIYV